MMQNKKYILGRNVRAKHSATRKVRKTHLIRTEDFLMIVLFYAYGTNRLMLTTRKQIQTEIERKEAHTQRSNTTRLDC